MVSASALDVSRARMVTAFSYQNVIFRLPEYLKLVLVFSIISRVDCRHCYLLKLIALRFALDNSEINIHNSVYVYDVIARRTI